MSKAPVVIVGAGIVGLCTAYELLARGRRVTILDRTPVSDSASCGNAGLLSIGHPPLTAPGVSWQGLKWLLSRTSPLIIRPSLSPELVRWLWNFHRKCNSDWFQRCMEPLCRIGFLTLARMEAYIDAESIACSYRRAGWLDVCDTDRALQQGTEEARLVERFGYRHEVLSGNELRRRAPAFRDHIVGAVHWTDSATIHPRDFMVQFARATVRRGALLRTDAEVIGLVRAEEESGRISGVRLASGEVVEASEVVLAAGFWSGAIAQAVGIALPMQAARGYHLQVEGMVNPPWTAAILSNSKVVVTPMGEQIRLAGTLEITPPGRPPIAARMAHLMDVARTHLHGLEQAKAVEEWSGFRPCTSDGMPVVGRVHAVKGLWLNTGHAMMGMTLGPISGVLLAQEMCGEKRVIESEMVSPNRLSSSARA